MDWTDGDVDPQTPFETMAIVLVKHNIFIATLLQQLRVKSTADFFLSLNLFCQDQN